MIELLSRRRHGAVASKYRRGHLHVDALTYPSAAGSLFWRGASSARGVISGSAAAAVSATRLLIVAMNFILNLFLKKQGG